MPLIKEVHVPLFLQGFVAHGLDRHVLPTKLGRHEHENELLGREVHTLPFKHGLDEQGFDWHVLPTKLGGHVHEKVVLDNEVQLAAF